jgi:hypothetical protein
MFTAGRRRPAGSVSCGFIRWLRGRAERSLRIVTESSSGRSADVTVLEYAGPAASVCTESDAVDLTGQALCLRARVVAIPAESLSPDFFALSSGVAGAIAGKFALYRIRLVIVGDISAHLRGSSALRAFVHEANKGPSIWFVPSADALRDRLEREFGRLASVTEQAADESG